MSCKVVPRVPGLPIRDCARSCNNREHMRTQLSAINVTEKAFFERLYLVSGLGTFGPGVKCSCAPTPPPFTQQLFLDFREFFFPEWPLIFLVSTILQFIWPSPGTLWPSPGTLVLPCRAVSCRGSFGRISIVGVGQGRGVADRAIIKLKKLMIFLHSFSNSMMAFSWLFFKFYDCPFCWSWNTTSDDIVNKKMCTSRYFIKWARYACQTLTRLFQDVILVTIKILSNEPRGRKGGDWKSHDYTYCSFHVYSSIHTSSSISR